MQINKTYIARAWLAGWTVLGSTVLSVISSGSMVLAQPGQPNQNLQLDGPESTVARFHQAIQNNDFDSLDNFYCSVEKFAAQALISRLDPDGQNRALLNAYLQIASTVNSIDMSQLRYETKYYDEELERAVVAITGYVTVESLNGESLILPYRQFSVIGNDWLRLIREDNEWKLCYNLTDPPQVGTAGDNGGLVFQTNSRVATTLLAG